MSLPLNLCTRTVDHITNELAMSVTSEQRLLSVIDGSDVGAHRVVEGGGVRLVYVGMTVEAFGLDSHMMFAFTSSDSAVPHFTLDAVHAGPQYAFHLDLIPRVDPGANLAYLEHCFVPLTEARDHALALEGLTPAHLAPLQWQLMSAWMLANRSDEASFAAIGPTVDTYRDHWLGLVANGVPAEAVGGSDASQLAARDAANRAAVFNPAVDPVWGQVERLLGTEASAEIQASLKDVGE